METPDDIDGAAARAAEYTYTQFLHDSSDLHLAMGGHWRVGQCYFNTMKSKRPELAEQLRASLFDPYFKDEISEATHTWAQKNW